LSICTETHICYIRLSAFFVGNQRLVQGETDMSRNVSTTHLVAAQE